MKYGRHTQCVCLCDCGKEHITTSEYLRKAKHPSCGCMSALYRARTHIKNEIGQTFGRLTIVDIDRSGRSAIAICRCSCGNEVRANKAAIVYGRTRSCGCLQRERSSQARTKDFSNLVSECGVSFLRPARLYERKTGGNTWLWICRCPLCGGEFEALPAKVLRNHTASCGCKISSARERLIQHELETLGVRYQREVRFPDCKYRYTLPFDFAVYPNNQPFFLIEYDGAQHYRPVDFFGGAMSFSETQVRDKIKTDYCQKNNIQLLRLRYDMTDEDIHTNIVNAIYP